MLKKVALGSSVDYRDFGEIVAVDLYNISDLDEERAKEILVKMREQQRAARRR